jgi:putative toxin-antitoxin system antitoxin component (TIGR02293 family)
MTVAPPKPAPNRALAAFRRARRGAAGENNAYVLLAGLKPQPTFSLLARVQKGLPASALERLREATGLGAAELLAALDLPERTWARRRKSGRLDPAESDRLLRLARVFAAALGLFDGDPRLAREWLSEPRRALGGRVPFALVVTELGAREVEALIGRIEHGVVG